MARLGPWDEARRVAVAVSGGPDSLALALLAGCWGDPAAFIVDHGLRTESAAEAEAARYAMHSVGISAHVLRLEGLVRGPGLAARARVARYAALTAACRSAGLVDLLLGHHAGDQAETVLMRKRRGSGPAGLAGMAALVETDHVRLVRPLLLFLPETLRDIVAASGLVPAEDPSNTDERTTRVRLRREIGRDRASLLAEAAQAGRTRTTAEAAVAEELAAQATIHPEGYAVLTPDPITGPALAALLRSLSGRRYPVPAATLREGTIAGVRIQPAGRMGHGWLLTREEAAMARPHEAAEAVWDGRFRLAGGPDDAVLGSLGDDASRMRDRSTLPSTVLRTLPAIRYKGVLSAVPHLDYDVSSMAVNGVQVRNACLPAAGAAFAAC